MTPPGPIQAFTDRFGKGDRPWIVLGKGPSFARWADLPGREAYFTLGLNHVVLQTPLDVWHVTDLHTFQEIAPAVTRRPPFTWLVLPWRPHVAYRPGKRTLAELVLRDRLLFALRDRLLTYRSSLDRRSPGPGPRVEVRLFSGVAAVSLLATAGVKTIHSLGIDGGAGYSAGFARGRLLANGRPSFDGQDALIRSICRRRNATYAKR